MTGFGQGFAQGDGLRADVEISSVNRKQLDVIVNLPRPLTALEPWVLEQLSHQLSRGRIQVQINLKATRGAAAGSVRIDRALAAQCVKEVQATAKTIGISPDVSFGDLLRIPGILVVHEAGEDVDTVKPVIEKALMRAMKAFAAMRQREGATLAADLSSRLDQLEAKVQKIAGRAPQLTGHYRAMLRGRIDQLASGLSVDDERMEKEVVLFADRADITEELTRLRSHLLQARGMLKQVEPAGRSLDFLAQEMFREINTIAAKASDAVISPVVVYVKAELERFREQVQNIE